MLFDEKYLDKNVHVFISFEMRRDKQPDNAIYSARPIWKNTYLKNYSVVGNSEEYGIGRLFIRFPIITPLQLDASQIIDAKYYTYSLTNNNDTFELVRIMEEWCSLTGNWNNNYKLGDRISTTQITDMEMSYNITEAVK